MQASIDRRFDNWTVPEPNTGCILWTGAIDGKGYGKIRVNGRLLSAHRFALERAIGPLDSGLYACHRCDTPACVNPDHLFAGTARDNMRDAWRKGRHPGPPHAPPRTSCRNGHALTPENTYTYGPHKTFKLCKACRMVPRREAQHGGARKYRAGCRCAVCVGAARQRNKRYNAAAAGRK